MTRATIAVPPGQPAKLSAGPIEPLPTRRPCCKEFFISRGTGTAVQVRLLGSVDVALDGAPCPVSGQRRRSVHAAERLLRQGVEAADPAEGAQHLRAALALWRGRPLADVASSPWLEEQAERLVLLQEQLRRALLEARLATGQHAELVPELELM